jgi:Leucine-rich repeat (LRR) protein
VSVSLVQRHLDFNANKESALSLFDALQHIDLFANSMSGPVPMWPMKLASSLKWLNIWGNRFTGTIPPQLVQLKSLLFLGFQDNALTGTIPPQLGQMTSLQACDLDNNQLNGTIPTELGQMIALGELGLYGNRLTGTIPSQLAQLTNLRNFGLFSNDLTGPVPNLPFKQYTNSPYCCLGGWDTGASNRNHFTCPLPPSADVCNCSWIHQPAGMSCDK